MKAFTFMVALRGGIRDLVVHVLVTLANALFVLAAVGDPGD